MGDFELCMDHYDEFLNLLACYRNHTCFRNYRDFLNTLGLQTIQCPESILIFKILSVNVVLQSQFSSTFIFSSTSVSRFSHLFFCGSLRRFSRVKIWVAWTESVSLHIEHLQSFSHSRLCFSHKRVLKIKTMYSDNAATMVFHCS